MTIYHFINGKEIPMTPEEEAEYLEQIAAIEASQPPAQRPSIQIMAAGFKIDSGALTVIEGATQLQMAYYETGYLFVGFEEVQIPADYLLFISIDKPLTIEQYKEGGFFELYFSNQDGDPADPGRIDVQVLKVR